jgi:hypothetical protein
MSKPKPAIPSANPQRRREIAWTSTTCAETWGHALTFAPREGAVIAFARRSTGKTRTTLLVQKPLMPGAGDLRHTQFGNVSLTAQYLNRALDELADADRNLGICILHTHPDGMGAPIWSSTDDQTDAMLGQYFFGHSFLALGAPLVSLVASKGTLRGREVVWNTSTRVADFKPIDRVRQLDGRFLEIQSMADRCGITASDIPMHADRALRVFGREGQRLLADLHVAIVGTGGVGSMVAEHLARWGIGEISLWDPDVVKDVNINRSGVFTFEDATKQRKKVDVVAEALPKFALRRDIRVNQSDRDARMSSELPALLDADLIVCEVDDARPRHFLNRLAYAHYIPVIDGANVIRSTAEDNPEAETAMVESGAARVNTIGPGHACLWCTGYLDARRLALAFRPEAEKAADRARGYVEGLGPEHAPSVMPMNTMTAALVEIRIQDLLFKLGSKTVTEMYFDVLANITDTLPRPRDLRCRQCAAWEGCGDTSELPYADL